MKKIKNTLKLISLVFLLNLSAVQLYGQENIVVDTTIRAEGRGVMAGTNVDINYLTKWTDISTPEIGNSMVYEADNRIVINPLFGEPNSREALLVNGNIGLINTLDFKEESVFINWGNDKELGRLMFKATNTTVNKTVMTLNGLYGYVGIGTETPEYLLHVNGLAFNKQLIVEGNASLSELFVTGGTTTTMFTLFNELEPPQAGYFLQSDAAGNGKWVELNVPNPSPWIPCGTSDIYYDQGHVGIGTQPSADFMLAVNGNINAKLLKISINVPASDYVFQENYKLMPLYELELFVNKNQHLPEVKSAQEFKEEGYNVGDMDDVLLRKVEELTLYTIAQQKQIDEQKKMVDVLIQQVMELNQQLVEKGNQ